MTHFPQPLTPNPQPRLCRRGISLLEVLISMGVLAVGIMGVAALIPAGRFEILQGAKADHAGMIGRAAFREIKVRGYLNPDNWVDSTGVKAFDPNNPGFVQPFYSPRWLAEPGPLPAVTPSPTPDLAVAIDPLGLAEGFVEFPKKAIRGNVALYRIYPHASFVFLQPFIFPMRPLAETKALADPIFRNGDDLVFTASTTKNAPPVQQMMGSSAKRASQGDYSWLATIVSDPTPPAPPRPASYATTGKVVVSVAVFYKRNFAVGPPSNTALGETVVPNVTFPGSGIGGGEVQLNFSPATIKAMKPGQWLMLAGHRRDIFTGKFLNYFRWYRVVAADVVIGTTQNVTLTGPDWDTNLNTQAWIFDGVIAVFEKNMRLELP